MAIFNMSDSSINEYINENKSIKQLANNFPDASDRDAKHRYMDYKEVVKSQGHEIAKGMKSDKALLKAHELMKNGKTAIAKQAETPAQQYLGKKASKKLAGTIGAELKKRGYDPKTGEKLREAAEYILSVLDEMDYIEED